MFLVGDVTGAEWAVIVHRCHTNNILPFKTGKNAPGSIPIILQPVGVRATAGPFVTATARGRTCPTNRSHFQAAQQLPPSLKDTAYLFYPNQRDMYFR